MKTRGVPLGLEMSFSASFWLVPQNEHRRELSFEEPVHLMVET
jgi:hypothetical protein